MTVCNVHSKHCPLVNCFAIASPLAGKKKFWVADTKLFFCFFFYFIMNKVVCANLAAVFDVPIFHFRREVKLLATAVQE